MDGVFGPFVPVGRALADAGHELIVATGLNLQNRIAEAGFATANAGPSAMEGAMAAMADPAVQLAGPDERWRFPATMFGGVIAPRKLSALRELADRFEPDLVLHPPVDLAGPLLAAERNLPSVSTDSCIRSSRRSCAEWRTASSRYGSRRDSKPIPTAASTAGVTLTRAPPSLRLHREAAETVAHPIRNEIPGDPEASLPGWAQRLGDRPTLYVSLGTVPFFNQPGRFQELLQEVVNDDVDSS